MFLVAISWLIANKSNASIAMPGMEENCADIFESVDALFLRREYQGPSLRLPALPPFGSLISAELAREITLLLTSETLRSINAPEFNERFKAAVFQWMMHAIEILNRIEPQSGTAKGIEIFAEYIRKYRISHNDAERESADTRILNQQLLRFERLVRASSDPESSRKYWETINQMHSISDWAQQPARARMIAFLLRRDADIKEKNPQTKPLPVDLVAGPVAIFLQTQLNRWTRGGMLPNDRAFGSDFELKGDVRTAAIAAQAAERYFLAHSQQGPMYARAANIFGQFLDYLIAPKFRTIRRQIRPPYVTGETAIIPIEDLSGVAPASLRKCNLLCSRHQVLDATNIHPGPGVQIGFDPIDQAAIIAVTPSLLKSGSTLRELNLIDGMQVGDVRRLPYANSYIVMTSSSIPKDLQVYMVFQFLNDLRTAFNSADLVIPEDIIQPARTLDPLALFASIGSATGPTLAISSLDNWDYRGPDRSPTQFESMSRVHSLWELLTFILRPEDNHLIESMLTDRLGEVPAFEPLSELGPVVNLLKCRIGGFKRNDYQFLSGMRPSVFSPDLVEYRIGTGDARKSYVYAGYLTPKPLGKSARDHHIYFYIASQEQQMTEIHYINGQKVSEKNVPYDVGVGNAGRLLNPLIMKQSLFQIFDPDDSEN